MSGLQAYVRILRRYWPVLVACAFIGIVISGLFALRVTPQYSATAEAFVSTQTAATPNDLNAANAFAQQAVQSYAKVASSPYVLNGVVTQLGLKTTGDALSSQVSVQTSQNSVVLDITATDPSPSQAARIANAVVTQLGRSVVTLNPQTTDLNSQVKVTTIRAAIAPATPTGSGLAFQALLGLLGGLVVGIGIIALREALDTRVRSVADIESLTKRPVLGAIAYDASVARHPLVIQDRPTGAEAEAFRALRAAVQVLREDADVRALVITSAEEGEGKSTVVANLAIALAANGVKTAVVDADLRRPRLAQSFGIESSVGLTDVLAAEIPLEQALQPWGNDGLVVLPAGRPAINANELLQTRTMRLVIDRLTVSHDIVLFDTPPLLPVSDAAVLARRTSGAVLVTAAGRVRKPQVQRARTVLDQMNARLFGIVVTMVPPKAARYGYAPAPEARYVRPTGPEPAV